MKRIRSIRLYTYLVEHNIDFNDQEAIALAKQNYRRKYKREWKRTAKRKKELRPLFSEQEYKGLCKRANLLGLKPTTYIRELVLTNQENYEIIPNKDQLLIILQQVSMAANQDKNNSCICQAEQLLLNYIRNH